MYHKWHTLINFYDPSKQAQAYHHISLLLEGLSNTKAYLGDVFHLHWCFMERITKSSSPFREGFFTSL